MRQETKTKAVSLATKSPIFCVSILQSLLTASRDKRLKFAKKMIIILPKWASNLLHLCWETLFH